MLVAVVAVVVYLPAQPCLLLDQMLQLQWVLVEHQQPTLVVTGV
jgi:hypothetical protein